MSETKFVLFIYFIINKKRASIDALLNTLFIHLIRL